MKRAVLGELCDFFNGGAWSDKEYVNAGIPVLKVTNCKSTGFQLDGLNYLSEKSREKYKKNELVIGDVIIATVGSHPNLIESAAGRSCIVNSQVEGFYLNQNAVCVRTKDKKVLSQKYLGYLCKCADFQHYIQSRGRGAANQMRIAISSIKEYSFTLPDIQNQHYIADILSTYDDIIENNQKQIKLLEEAAQRLYKEWFVDLRFPGHENTKIVDGVPEGWIKEEIGKIIKKVHRTKQIVASEYKDEGSIPIVDQSRAFVAGYTNDLETRVDFGIPIIVFGDHTRIVKLIQFPFAKGADGTQLIISDCLEMPQRLLYCSIMNVDLSNYHYARHFKYLKEEKIMIPTVKVANEFENNVTGIFSKIQNCRDEIIRCQKTRDLLLPKLMSGEVEV